MKKKAKLSVGMKIKTPVKTCLEKDVCSFFKKSQTCFFLFVCNGNMQIKGEQAKKKKHLNRPDTAKKKKTSVDVVFSAFFSFYLIRSIQHRGKKGRRVVHLFVSCFCQFPHFHHSISLLPVVVSLEDVHHYQMLSLLHILDIVTTGAAASA